MENFEFVIPLNKDDLLKPGPGNQYYVTDLLSPKEIAVELKDCFTVFKQHEDTFILSKFGVLFSVLKEFHQLEDRVKEQAWELILKAMSALVKSLSNRLEINDEENRSDSTLNSLKMLTYIFCQLLEAFENEATQPSINGTAKKKGKTKKSDTSFDIDTNRDKAMNLIYQLVQLPINRMWSPPVVDSEFVNLLSNCCYKALENPSVSRATFKSSRESIFQILGTLVKRYNHGLSCTVRIMQMLQHFEHIVSSLAGGVAIMVTAFGCNMIISDVIREINRVDPRDLSRDLSSTRNYANFLVELAEKAPGNFISVISLLSVHLDSDNYSLRQAVLSIFGEIVIQVLSGEDLDKRGKTQRDQLLDQLTNHVHDVNAHVRSRTLQIWDKLGSKGAIPLNKQHKVLDLGIGRLQDRSSIVRKNAVGLVTSLLQANPFAAKLTTAELENKYETELNKLQQMAPELNSQSMQARRNKQMKKHRVTEEEMWDAMLPEIEKAFEEWSSSQNASQDELVASWAEECLEWGTKDDAYQCLRKALYEAKVRKATFLAMQMTSVFPEQEEDRDDGSNQEIQPSTALQIMESMKEIFISSPVDQTVEEEDEKDVEEDVEEDSDDQTEENTQASHYGEDVMKQKVLVKYLKDCIYFIKSLLRAIPVLSQLLGSKQASDVMETIEFFVIAHEFGLVEALTGIRRMLVLIFSREQTVKDAVVAAYKRLYIDSKLANSRASAVQVIKNLTTLVNGASVGELTSLEELVSEFVKTGGLNKECIQVLWERFTMKIQDTTEIESKASLVLLGMVANAERQTINSNINVLISIGLGERGRQDFRIVHDTCVALTKLVPPKQRSDSTKPPLRFESDHELFDSLKNILTDGITRLDDNHYIPMSAQAISVIYQLADSPDTICCDILRSVCKNFREIYTTVEDGSIALPSKSLSRLLALFGHIALRQMTHLDVNVFGELKRRALIKEEEEANQRGKKSAKDKRASWVSTAFNTTTKKDSEEEEDDIMGAVADDAEGEFIRAVCENELVSGDTLLSKGMTLLGHVCLNPGKYSDVDLRASASLSLAKCMLVSSKFCDANLQLLFTILERSKEPVIRGNIVIALGDMSFRYPNLVEPWTPRIYARLRDDSNYVRRTTLTVLTHLILNDMVKVKGQISDMALCVIDDDSKISGLSKLFFTELAQKGNALYNVMPDIISRLSDPDAKVEEESFQTILRFIIGLIQKERQSDSLVEKLMHRLGASRMERQWRDLAYCISLLPSTDRSLRKIQENFQFLVDKLHEDSVFEYFTQMLQNSKKLAKPEVKTLVEELEKRMEEVREKGTTDCQTASKASMAKQKAAKEVPKKKSKKPARRKVASDSEESQASDDSDGPDLHPAHRNHPANMKPPPPSKPREVRTRGRISFAEQSDSDEDFDTRPTKGPKESRQNGASNGASLSPSPPSKKKAPPRSARKR